MSPAETTIGMVLLVGVVALVMRWTSGDRTAGDETTGGADDVDRMLAEVSDADPEMAGEMVAITSEGWSFVPDGHGVRLLPPPGGEGHPMRLDAGDSIGARVVKGSDGFDPWRLESLGRDHDYHAWFFETRDAADAALHLLERRIVRPRRDEAGEPAAVADAEFDEARLRDEDTERALDAPDEP